MGSAGNEPGDAPSTLLITCGALAREVLALNQANGWHHYEVTAIPADLHNRPERIPEAVRAKIRAGKESYQRILVLYGDCGTGGGLDRVLEEEGVERISGPHCYQIYAGKETFETLAEAEPGTFYLTDFDRLVIEGLGLDRHPELRDLYFGNYTRLIYLAQTKSSDLEDAARRAADRLQLSYAYQFTGYGDLARFLDPAA